MPLTNCTRCGSVFSRINKLICPECIRKEEADFEKAVEWLRDNPKHNVQALSEATGIEKRDILRWIREKRIVMMDSSGSVTCRKCGVPISAGNFCDHCKLGLTQEVSENLKAIDEEKKLRHPTGEKEKGFHYRPLERGRGG
jgi:predicted amidophosphoribosyltransferase